MRFFFFSRNFTENQNTEGKLKKPFEYSFCGVNVFVLVNIEGNDRNVYEPIKNKFILWYFYICST